MRRNDCSAAINYGPLWGDIIGEQSYSRKGFAVNYRRLGRAGLKVSELSFGAWVTFAGQVDDDAAAACMTAAYDAGVNFFDNAEAYAGGQAESMMGRVLKRTGWRREDLVISTKLFWGDGHQGPNDQGLSHKHLMEGIHNSLHRLQLEYVDLLYCHRPDPNTPMEETVRAMTIIIQQGKAFYCGTSEWSAAEVLRAHGVAREYGLIPPTMEQPQYNMFQRERFEKEYAPLFRELGYGSTIFSPLASGVLSGKYNNGIPADSRAALKGYEWVKNNLITPERIDKVKQLEPIARELGGTMAQLALAWCLQNPNVSSVITGASRPEQVRDNMPAVELAPKLTPEVMARIETILGNKPK
jgi:voltage-dependent potassium channel beta subunit